MAYTDDIVALSRSEFNFRGRDSAVHVTKMPEAIQEGPHSGPYNEISAFVMPDGNRNIHNVRVAIAFPLMK